MTDYTAYIISALPLVFVLGYVVGATITRRDYTAVAKEVIDACNAAERMAEIEEKRGQYGKKELH